MADYKMTTVPVDRYWTSGSNRLVIPRDFGMGHTKRIIDKGFTGADGHVWNTSVNSTSSGYAQDSNGLYISNLSSQAWQTLLVGYSTTNAMLKDVIGFSCYTTTTTDGKNNPTMPVVGGVWTTPQGLVQVYKLDVVGGGEPGGYKAYIIPSNRRRTVMDLLFAGVIAQCRTSGTGSINSRMYWKLEDWIPMFASASNAPIYDYSSASTQKTLAVIPYANGSSTWRLT